ncbi:c-type cytochrome biogenesis protein CcsB [Desulfopila sp. IMCC35006]|uniref:c-type cytochrome biogenesis protein CcsB n=1 Tax=Desulfopila sp. IMCC35006 TaxID=2569542 RepID=UPI0010ABD5F3|nr:c-type cytochrome biogenesis protein CcsB [Desulfopila sp. IMCC35006]TKB27729.1 c-type cytochrome biogenesis protein CcsB [Desulfopila sp. IMCC35006]
MDSSQLLGITTFTYMLSTVLYIAILVFKTPRLGGIATLFTALAWFVQTAGLVMRWIESYQLGIGHAPLTNMYESVVFFAWTIILLYLLIEWKFKTKIIGAFAVPFAFLAMAYASFSTDLDKTINPLIPALQSNWLIAHVVTCFVGYASFAVAAALGIMYLLKNKSTASGNASAALSSRFPSPVVIDDIIHKTMVFGFIWLSGGIITGAVWANSAWGTYWSWDPKETWSLITWFFYAIILHSRYTRGWSGKKIAVLAIFGFLSVLFTYYGVNFLLSGLHSYGSS